MTEMPLELTTSALLLGAHHRAIDEACVALRASAFTDDPREVVESFRNLEHAVLVHMQAEEDEILAAYGHDAPHEAADVLAAHEGLRQQLYQLAIDVELHRIRLEAIDELIAALRTHAASEDREMYPWAQIHLSPSKLVDLFHRINESLNALDEQRQQTRSKHRVA